MRFRSFTVAAPLGALLAALVGCAPTIVPEPGGRPAPSPPPPPPPVAQVQPGPDLQDWTVTPGTWTYARDSRVSTARFGLTGAAPAAWLRCDLTTRGITVGRTASTVQNAGPSAMMAVVTSFGRSEWPARAVSGGMEAARGASDPGLDAIAFSRGRFALMLAGQTPVVLPSWAEPVRVIEDCRN
ncbi:hypothetical protein BH10PSE13_BH10PSE13_17610 [soil metagenome]